jgi:3-deoxy-7-phosphoheptulonate synthase
MIAVLKQGATEKQIENLSSWLRAQGLDVHISKGSTHTVIGLIGDTTRIDEDLLRGLEMVETVKRISEPFKSANRKFHPDDSVIKVGNT